LKGGRKTRLRKRKECGLEMKSAKLVYTAVNFTDEELGLLESLLKQEARNDCYACADYAPVLLKLIKNARKECLT
jgi:hypothetical protein